MSSMNPMNLDAQGAARTLSSINQAAIPLQEAPTPQSNPAQQTFQKVIGEFRDSWASFESLNSKYGGDVEAFRSMQKAAENWLASLTSNLPESSPSSTQNY